MIRSAILLAALSLLLPGTVLSQGAAPPAPRVGPAAGTVIPVGGGQLGPEIRGTFIEAAGGPDALIVVVPTAGGGESYPSDYPGAEAWRNAGARHVVVLHTTDRAVANSDSFAAVLDRAGGVWFDGGRQYRLVDAYAGTKTEAGFHSVLARGGVVAGSSAGATILGDFLVRGAPSNDNLIMDDPSHEKGFAFLRGVGIDQHVVARERLPDLADSIVPRYPDLLPISADEGTAWVVRGDTATIIGAGQAFAYQAREHDPGKPFVTLHPGDVFDLAGRAVVRRAGEDRPDITRLAEALLAPYQDATRGGATLLVAQGGRVLVDRSWGVEQGPRYMPTTTLPLFDVGAIGAVIDSLCAQLPAPPARPGRGGNGAQAEPLTLLQACLTRSVGGRFGLHRTRATAGGAVQSSVDELYRLVLGLMPPDRGAGDGPRSRVDVNRGWEVDPVGGGEERYAAFGTADGRRAAIERVPARGAAIILLTGDPRADAKGIADRLLTELLTGGPS
jgi:cyanophycinase